MGSMKRIIIVQFLSPLFRLLHLRLLRPLPPFLRSVSARAEVRHQSPFLRRDFVDAACTYICVLRDPVKHTSVIHHSIRELCRDKRFCVPEELTCLLENIMSNIVVTADKTAYQ